MFTFSDGTPFTASYNPSGSGPIVITAPANESLDRTATLKVQVSESLSQSFTITQPGLYEEIVLADGSVLECSDGKFAVLK